MAVHFIIGRSGAGKTRFCVERVTAALAESAEGSPLLLLVPEQATFQIERALLDSVAQAAGGGTSIVGVHRARVLSFQRFARLIFSELGGPSDPPISSLAKQMALRAVLDPIRSRLPTFASSIDRPGFLARLAELFREFHQYQVDSTRLRDRASRPGSKGVSRLGRKLNELADAFDAFNDYLRSAHFTDPDAALTIAAERLCSSRLARGADVWVDGFAGFTPQELSFLGELAAVADSLNIALIGEPEITSADAAAGLFRRSRQTYGRLCRVFAGKGVPVGRPVLLAKVYRFAPDSALARIERDMFEQQGPVASSAAGQADPGHPVKAAEVLLVEAPDRRAEVRAAVNHIRHLIAVDGYRYRDISVIVRSIDDYWQFISEAFGDAGVPFFVDRRESISHHPLIELVRSAVGAVVRRLDARDVIAFLKTDLPGGAIGAEGAAGQANSPQFRDCVDRLENYALEFGLSGPAWLSPDEWNFHEHAAIGQEDLSDGLVAELDAMRKLAAGALAPLGELYRLVASAGGELAIRQWTAALWRMLVAMNVHRTLDEWAKDDTPAQAVVHGQAFEAVKSLLADLTTALGDRLAGASEFAGILEAGLSQLTLGLVPPALDQVLVGAIERSRHPDIKVALVLGMAERSFPRLAGVQAILTDHERDALAAPAPESGQRGENVIELAPSRTELLFDEDLLAYLALTRPAEQLWVSYPLADDGGKPINPSRYVHRLTGLLGDRVTTLRLADRHEALAAVTPSELAGVIAGQSLSAGGRTATGRLCCQRLTDALQAIAPAELARAGESLRYSNNPTLSPQIAGQLFASSGAVSASVTRLEAFAACPFKHLACYGLALEPRRSIELDAIQLGRLYHELLRELFERLRAEQHDGVNWAERSADELRTLVGELVSGARQRLEVPALDGGLAGWLLAQAGQVVGDLAEAMRAAAEASPTVRQIAAELTFGLGPDSHLPALRIGLHNKRVLLVRGKIDRVDRAENGAMFVIDYKTGPSSVNWSLLAHGLSLQLQTYLLVLRQHAQSLAGTETATRSRPFPAGAFFQQIAISPPTDDPPGSNDDPPGELDLLAQYQRRGIFIEKSASLLDCRQRPGGKSPFVRFKLNKDGSPAANGCDAVTDKQFAGLLELAETRMRQFGQAILAGEASVWPYRLANDTPCGFCDYRAVCRMDFSYNRPRYLETRTRKQVLGDLSET